MKRNTRHPHQVKKRRTTLSLPADSLGKAEKIARARKMNLSTVVSEALEEGLRVQLIAERCEEILNAYKRAFSGLNDEETALVDGIILEPRRNSRRG